MVLVPDRGREADPHIGKIRGTLRAAFARGKAEARDIALVPACEAIPLEEQGIRVAQGLPSPLVENLEDGIAVLRAEEEAEFDPHPIPGDEPEIEIAARDVLGYPRGRKGDAPDDRGAGKQFDADAVGVFVKHPFAFEVRPIWRVDDRDVGFPRVTGVARRALAFDFEEARGRGVVERGDPGPIDDRRDPRFGTGLVVGEIIPEIEPELIGREILGNRKGQGLFDGPGRLEDGE